MDVNWTKEEPLERSTNRTARALAIWSLQQKGLIDLSHGSKVSLAKKLGISRHTLDRTLEIIDQAKALAIDIEKNITTHNSR